MSAVIAATLLATIFSASGYVGGRKPATTCLRTSIDAVGGDDVPDEPIVADRPLDDHTIPCSYCQFVTLFGLEIVENTPEALLWGLLLLLLLLLLRAAIRDNTLCLLRRGVDLKSDIMPLTT